MAVRPYINFGSQPTFASLIPIVHSDAIKLTDRSSNMESECALLGVGVGVGVDDPISTVVTESSESSWSSPFSFPLPFPHFLSSGVLNLFFLPACT